MPVAFASSAALCYLAAILNVDGALVSAASVERAIPQTADRIAILAQYDTRSLHAYTATLAAGLVIVPVFLVANAIGYWETVVASGGCRAVSALSSAAVLPFLLVCAISAGVAFAYAPVAFNPRWPGRTSILFWPTFPAIGSIVHVAFAIGVFFASVGVLKFVFGLRGRSR